MIPRTTRPRMRAILSAVAALALVAVVAGPATAGTPAHGRISHGDVSAAFQARTTGGFVNLLNGRTVAAPVRGLLDGRISPFLDGTYCASDWHYLGVTLLGEGGYQAASAYLDAVSIEYFIDDVLVAPTMRTAIKPFVGTGISGQYGVSVGALVAPGSIGAGDHTLETHISTPESDLDALVVTFSVTPDACF